MIKHSSAVSIIFLVIQEYDQFEEQYDVIRNIGIQTSRIVLNGWPHGFGSDGGWIKQYADWLEEIFKQE